MRKKLLRLLFILSLAVFSSSCSAGFTGTATNSTALSQDNFRYVERDLSGKAQATYVLGIGGMNHEALVSEAKEDMLLNHQLEDGQALANMTVNFKYSSFLGVLVRTAKCYVTADIVEFE